MRKPSPTPVFVTVGIVGALLVLAATPANLKSLIWLVVAIWSGFVIHVAISGLISRVCEHSWSWSKSAQAFGMITLVIVVFLATCCWQVRFDGKGWEEAASELGIEVGRVFFILVMIEAGRNFKLVRSGQDLSEESAD